jgi:hypothetical protein
LNGRYRKNGGGLALSLRDEELVQAAGRLCTRLMTRRMTAATRRRWMRDPMFQMENPRNQRISRMTRTVHSMTPPLSLDA